jgi:hypothetical protein
MSPIVALGQGPEWMTGAQRAGVAGVPVSEFLGDVVHGFGGAIGVIGADVARDGQVGVELTGCKGGDPVGERPLARDDVTEPGELEGGGRGEGLVGVPGSVGGGGAGGEVGKFALAHPRLVQPSRLVAPVVTRALVSGAIGRICGRERSGVRIQAAIVKDAFVFIACFSPASPCPLLVVRAGEDCRDRRVSPVGGKRRAVQQRRMPMTRRIPQGCP